MSKPDFHPNIRLIAMPDNVSFGWLPDIGFLNVGEYQIKHYNDVGTCESVETIKAGSLQKAVEYVARQWRENGFVEYYHDVINAYQHGYSVDDDDDE